MNMQVKECVAGGHSLSYESLSHLLERASPSTILRYIASGSGRLLSLRRLAASLAMKGSHLEGAVAPVGDASSKASDGGGGRSGGDHTVAYTVELYLWANKTKQMTGTLDGRGLPTRASASLALL